MDITFYSEIEGDLLHIRARTESREPAMPTMIQTIHTGNLFSVLIKDGETGLEATARALEVMFDFSELAAGDDLEVLEQEFRRHSHGQPE